MVGMKIHIASTSQTTTVINFGIIKSKKYDSQLETNKAYAKMIKIIKQDIADFEKRNAAETKQKLNEIWKEL